MSKLWEKKTTFVYRHNAYSNLNDNPVAYFLGVLGTSVARVGTSTGKLAYQVKFVKDGLTVDLGIATGKDPITQMIYYEKTREALETKDPSRKGMVSERDMVDFRDGAKFTYTAVPFPKKNDNTEG